MVSEYCKLRHAKATANAKIDAFCYKSLQHFIDMLFENVCVS